MIVVRIISCSTFAVNTAASRYILNRRDAISAIGTFAIGSVYHISFVNMLLVLDFSWDSWQQLFTHFPRGCLPAYGHRCIVYGSSETRLSGVDCLHDLV